jgi:hypothetical protein
MAKKSAPVDAITLLEADQAAGSPRLGQEASAA